MKSNIEQLSQEMFWLQVCIPEGTLSITFFIAFTIFLAPIMLPIKQIDSIGSFTSYEPKEADVKQLRRLNIKKDVVAASTSFIAKDDSCSIYDITAIGESRDLMHFFAWGVSSSSINLGLDSLGCIVFLCI